MKKIRTFSVAALLFLFAAAAMFVYLVYSSQLIPNRMLVIASILLFIVLLFISILVIRPKSKFLVVLGGVLSVILGFVLVFAAIYLNRAVNTAQNITTTTKVQVSTVSVYMIADETNDSTALTADMKYGILEEQDRENTDEVIKVLQEEFGTELAITSYHGVNSILDALFNHNVDAIILNSALLNIVDETEGFEDISNRVREIRKTQVKREVVVEDPQPLPAGNRGNRDNDASSTGNANPDSTASDNRTFTISFSGIDNRGPLIEKSRSDVNIIGVVNPDTHQVLLVTTPRDSFVPLKFPDYVTSKDKLTHAGIYGVQVSMDTLSMLYDIDLDYYFRVNFDGFMNIVDAMGGVTVDVDQAFGTTEFSFPAGPNLLTGYKALSFVRNRFLIGDSQRARNQMAFIKGVIKKATSTDMLLRFNDILKAVEGSFETSMPYDEISTLVREQIETGAEWNVVTYAVTGTGTSAIPYSMNVEVYVLIPDEDSIETAKDLMQQVYDGKIISAPES